MVVVFPAWWRGQKGYADKLQQVQNTASRRILGAFHTFPIIPMELKASLPPTSIRLQQTCRKYALRTMTLPVHHPIQQIIIIIVHYMLAASRLWHSIVQDLGVQPIFSYFSLLFLSMHSCEVLLFLFLFSPLSTGTMLYQF